jgi:hypothetical protein
VEESTKEIGMAAEASTTEAQLVTDGSETVGAEVGSRGALEPRPQAFDWVQLGGIGWKAMHREPGALGLEVGTGLEAAVRVQAVPEQDDGSSDVTTQMPEEAHDLGGADRLRMGHQEDVGTMGRSRSVSEGTDHR